MEKFSKLENRLSKNIGRLIAERSLIENNDRVLVGVSGGKDSLTLLKLLAQRKKWVPIKYDIVACHILSNHLCNGCKEINELGRFFEEIGCEYVFEKSSIINEEKPFSCFWCAWNRRKAIFQLADRLNCRKIALGHHMDDIAETVLMNLFFHGEIASMNIKQPLFDGKIVIIRPMAELEEKIIAEYAKRVGFPEFHCNCPNAKDSKRRYVKDLVKKLDREFKHVKKNIMKAPRRIKTEYLG